MPWIKPHFVPAVLCDNYQLKHWVDCKLEVDRQLFLLQGPLEVQGITYFGARELYVIMALFCHIVINMTRARIVDDPRVASQLGTLADNCHIVLVYFSIVSSQSTSNIQNGFILKLKLKSRNKRIFFYQNNKRIVLY